MNAIHIVYTICAAVLFSWSVWCVFSPDVRDGIFGKIIYSVIGLTAFSIIFADGVTPIHHVTLIACMAALAIRHFVLTLYWGKVREFLGVLPPYNNRRGSDL